MARLIFGFILILSAIGLYFALGYIGKLILRRLRKEVKEQRQERSGGFEEGTHRRHRGAQEPVIVNPVEESPAGPSKEEEPLQIPLPLWIRLRGAYSAALILLTLFLWATTSWVIVSGDMVGHLDRVFTGSPMEPGQVVAKRGQKGKQAGG